MATPYSQSISNDVISTLPSRTLLQQLLEEINVTSAARTVRSKSPSQSLASTCSRASSRNHSRSFWVGGSAFAQDARAGLRAADEARLEKTTASSTDGAPDSETSRLFLDTSRLDMQGQAPNAQRERSDHAGARRTPDAVAQPYEYMQYMLNSAPPSTTSRRSPGKSGFGNSLTQTENPHLGEFTHAPLSPLIFSDVYFDSSSSSLSPQTEMTVSPTEAPTSAATSCTVAELRTPTIDDVLKQTSCPSESRTPTASQKRRTMTAPDIRSAGYFEMNVDAPRSFIGLCDDNRYLLRHETFIERSPTPQIPIEMTSNNLMPALSSFRPNAADPQGQSTAGPYPQRIVRTLTSPVRPASPTQPDTPAWLRPMHLVDTGGKSIYTNVHDDGPIRHALCLWCFRTRGSFRKVHRHGYESCGRREVLDSHYWEDDKWTEDSSDESTASDA